MFEDIVEHIQAQFDGNERIILHEPVFIGNDKAYLNECIDSTMVSSVGPFVEKFEKEICKYTGANFAVATSNGTSALHLALATFGVNEECEVLTQALSFVATSNAIAYTGASPIFIDSDKENLGMSPAALAEFLELNTYMDDSGRCINKATKKWIKVCLPMHVLGHPIDLDKISSICTQYNIEIIEDAAESIGSLYKGKHTGTQSAASIISFNGNKTITCGGGGIVLFKEEAFEKKARHLSTTAKTPHPYEFHHDQIGYNYRMPNLNAALGLAQLESLPTILENKRQLAQNYKSFFENHEFDFIDEPEHCQSNFWLNAINLKDLKTRNQFIEYSSSKGVMTRPLWKLLPDLPAFKSCQKTDLTNSMSHQGSIVNIPSSYRMSSHQQERVR